MDKLRSCVTITNQTLNNCAKSATLKVKHALFIYLNIHTSFAVYRCALETKFAPGPHAPCIDHQIKKNIAK